VLVRDDPAAFADACIALHEDERLWSTMSQAARERSLDWSVPALSQALGALLNEVLSPTLRISRVPA
jgi:glycosyltransferase involved in cell wall biosynthesis